MLDVGVVLRRGNHAVGPDDSAVSVVLVLVVEDAARDFDGADAPSRSRGHGGHGLAAAAVKELVDEPHRVMDCVHALDELGDVVHEGVVAHRRQVELNGRRPGLRVEPVVVVVDSGQGPHGEGLAGKLAPLRGIVLRHVLVGHVAVVGFGHFNAVGGDQASADEGVLSLGLERNEFRFALEIGDLQRAEQLDGCLQIVDRTLEPGFQIEQDALLGHPGHAPDLNRHGVRGAARHLVADAVGQPLEPGRQGKDVGLELLQRDRAGESEEIRRGEEEQVQDMALQRLAVLGQQTQRGGGLGNGHAECVLRGSHAGQAVADGADAADAGRQNPRRRVMLATQHHLEETRRLDDLPACFGQVAAADADSDVAVAFHPGEVVDVDVQVNLHRYSLPGLPQHSLSGQSQAREAQEARPRNRQRSSFAR